MIALTRKKARWPEPAGNDGRWIYVELILDGGPSAGAPKRVTLGGWVNVLPTGTGYADWLTHELLGEMEALKREEDRARTPKDYSARMFRTLRCAVETSGMVVRSFERPIGCEHYRRRAHQ